MYPVGYDMDTSFDVDHTSELLTVISGAAMNTFSVEVVAGTAKNELNNDGVLCNSK